MLEEAKLARKRLTFPDAQLDDIEREQCAAAWSAGRARCGALSCKLTRIYVIATDRNGRNVGWLKVLLTAHESYDEEVVVEEGAQGLGLAYALFDAYVTHVRQSRSSAPQIVRLQVHHAVLKWDPAVATTSLSPDPLTRSSHLNALHVSLPQCALDNETALHIYEQLTFDTWTRPRRQRGRAQGPWTSADDAEDGCQMMSASLDALALAARHKQRAAKSARVARGIRIHVCEELGCISAGHTQAGGAMTVAAPMGVPAAPHISGVPPPMVPQVWCHHGWPHMAPIGSPWPGVLPPLTLPHHDAPHQQFMDGTTHVLQRDDGGPRLVDEVNPRLVRVRREPAVRQPASILLEARSCTKSQRTRATTLVREGMRQLLRVREGTQGEWLFLWGSLRGMMLTVEEVDTFDADRLGPLAVRVKAQEWLPLGLARLVVVPLLHADDQRAAPHKLAQSRLRTVVVVTFLWVHPAAVEAAHWRRGEGCGHRCLQVHAGSGPFAAKFARQALSRRPSRSCALHTRFWLC